MHGSTCTAAKSYLGELMVEKKRFMRVAEFIRTHPDEFESAWETFAKVLSSFAPDLSVSELRNHLRDILLALANDIETPQSQEEQAEKSKGNAMRDSALDRISALHAACAWIRVSIWRTLFRNIVRSGQASCSC